VFTRKVSSDLSYLACARRLFADPLAFYPAFATHNAHTLAAVAELAISDGGSDEWEYQRLHGMGEELYDQIVGKDNGDAPAASTRRSAATRTCWHTWCADCSRTVPTRHSSTASPTPTCRSTR
jgi:hypothetical protein